MWGNRLGWVLSGLIVLIVWLTLSHLSAAGSPTEPTDRFVSDPASVAPMQLPASPESVVPADDACDAGPLYRKAIDAYKAAEAPGHVVVEAPAFDNFTKYTRLDAVPADVLAKVKGVADECLVPATHCKNMKLFADHPEEVVNYEKWEYREPLVALDKVGNAVLHLALLTGVNDEPAAVKYYEAVYALGAKLYGERMVYQEWSIAAGLMSGASQMLARRSPDPARRDAAKNFDAQYRGFIKTGGPVESKWHFLSSIDDNVVARRAGDVFYLAKNSKDRMWRVEAILQLGRFRFMAGNRGDQSGSNRLVKQLANDADPAVRAAAVAARDMTLDQFKMQ